MYVKFIASITIRLSPYVNIASANCTYFISTKFEDPGITFNDKLFLL